MRLSRWIETEKAAQNGIRCVYKWLRVRLQFFVDLVVDTNCRTHYNLECVSC